MRQKVWTEADSTQRQPCITPPLRAAVSPYSGVAERDAGRGGSGERGVDEKLQQGGKRLLQGQRGRHEGQPGTTAAPSLLTAQTTRASITPRLLPTTHTFMRCPPTNNWCTEVLKRTCLHESVLKGPCWWQLYRITLEQMLPQWVAPSQGQHIKKNGGLGVGRYCTDSSNMKTQITWGICLCPTAGDIR